MQLGMIGLGRMGGNLVRRLMRHGHQCVVHDVQPAAIEALRHEGATGAASLDEMLSLLQTPRILWLMMPAAAVDATLTDLVPRLSPGDIVIDGGNSYYRDDIRRSVALREEGIHFVDVGTSGGIAGLERGYCLMVGGEADIATYLTPIFTALTPGTTDSAGRKTNADVPGPESGYLYCGLHGAGHFVKMIHNGIEYGMMAAYAEGMNILKHANIGIQQREVSAEITPLPHPEYYQYDFNLPDIAEVWRHGSVIDSWLLEKMAGVLRTDPALEKFPGHVADSGEGRWTIAAAIDEAVPAPVLSAALYARFSSRGQGVFADQLLSAMRYAFGGHVDAGPPEKSRDA
ncbi:phosphogluconate dehydrogenase (NAD(+)-dependent, decarboxylating) [Pandoraea fibrosis]|uniref:6-phosphogluconate dehydrogenase n=1 Tax=Pandoraea fibrosis TaxID=1891094 RepID=A0A5E4S509_9BURK|nr:decarboxylating 6-phosphogluconate dehydrogenase [Pandoraea fibrosis]VVD69812.1 6-phosphogluconate dehydrogenase [Pandoraea fibrosis]